MFARLTPIIIALFAIASTAVAMAEDCQTTCCQTASLAPTGWQGASCMAVEPDGVCEYTKFCCYIIEGDRAGKCTEPFV
ncbi:hypothetical protein PAXRUDRAFT_823988 [Paxillus rubicundulus Ve08.2h10]|uniref:Uncharacterized protein n=1 Tax=Paxillus rubicundulus Ve08.2h10 TaxID=930991 RepID=A0A0D0EBV8_9AGAM|nr:hypothetical protein PAXRUDRAFT_823988 [Paxillus rubicundulus Ve08.2h10]